MPAASPFKLLRDTEPAGAEELLVSNKGVSTSQTVPGFGKVPFKKYAATASVVHRELCAREEC